MDAHVDPASVTSYDPAAIESYLECTDKELLHYIDPEHMSYLPLYLGRADARHARGEPPETVFRELWLASKVYAAHGAIMLTKWPPTQVRRRRLDPFECGLLAGDRDVLKKLAKVFGIDPMVLYAGLEPDDITAEVSALTTYFKSETVSDPIELAGTLAIFYWLMLASAADEDLEGFEIARRRAMRCHDDFGHLAGGASGGIARIRVIHQALAAIRPANADGLAKGIVQHAGLWQLEHDRQKKSDADAKARGAGGLDKTALALMALGKAFDIELGPALVSQGAPTWILRYASALGHTPPHAD
jgi:hypothetical protein